MAKISIGPFSVQDISGIEPILNDLNVAYEVRRDEDLLTAEEEQRRPKGQSPFTPLTLPNWALQFIFIDFDDSDIPKIGNRLEPFGIVLESTR